MPDTSHCARCGAATDAQVRPACWQLIHPKLETPFELMPVESTVPDVPSEIIYKAKLATLLPFQMELLKAMPKFERKVWLNRLRRGLAAG